MTERQDDAPSMAALEALLEEVRAARIDPEPEFLARLTDQALAAMPEPAAPVSAPRRRSGRGWLATLGGWPAMGGLAAATVTGFWLGFAPPAPLSSLAGGIEAVDLLPEPLALFEEAGA